MSLVALITSLFSGIEFPVVFPDSAERILACLKYSQTAPLQLPSVFMLCFLLCFLPLLALVSRSTGLRKLLIAAASVWLYYKLSGSWVWLLLLLAFLTWGIALAVQRRLDHGRGTSGWVAVAVGMNLLLLVLFKAGGAFGPYLGEVVGQNWMRLAIPAGISFFCFQSISYVVDCRRGRIRARSSFLDVLLLLAYFPKMFLGPLVRNADFIASMQNPRLSLSREERAGAIRRIIFGLVKFCILSRVIGRFLVDPVFAAPSAAGGPASLLAVYAYTFQLYCDFSGYTDLAIGISFFLGIPLPENFALPYHSASITEFWRRWHISLSTWLRDYLYISMGGNRKGRLRTYFNLLVTMVLGGLWHGVGVMFLLWGLWHGVLLCLHKLMLGMDNRIARYWFGKTGASMRTLPRAVGIFVTFNAVAFGWLMFRSPDWEVFTTIAGNIASFWSASDFESIASIAGSVSGDISSGVALGISLVALAVAVVTHFMPSSLVAHSDRLLCRLGFWGQCLILVLVIWAAMQTSAQLFPDATSALPVYANF